MHIDDALSIARTVKWKGQWSSLRGFSKVERRKGGLWSFCQAIWQTHEKSEKEGMALCGSTFAVCPEKGYMRRKESLLEEIYLVGLDYDKGDKVDLEKWKNSEIFPGAACVIHSSPSDGKKDEETTEVLCKFRVWLPLSRPILSHEWKRIAPWFYSRVGSVDPSCKDATRLFYTVRCMYGAPWIHVRPGEVIDPDVLLSMYDEEPQESPANHSSASTPQAGGAKERYANVALDKAAQSVASMGKGGRNDNLNKESFSIGTLVGAGVLSENEAFSTLMQAALSCGLKEKEAQSTIRSGLNAGMAEPRDLSNVKEKKKTFERLNQAITLQPPPLKNVSPPTESTKEESNVVALHDIEIPEFNTFVYELPPSPLRGDEREKTPAAFVQLAMELTPYGNAKRMFEHYGEQVLHNESLGWYAWDGRRWERSSSRVSRLYWDMVDRHLAPEMSRAGHFDDAKEVAKWIVNSKKKTTKNDSIDILGEFEELEVQPDDLDSQKKKLNVMSGILDLESGELSPHDPEQRHSRLAPVSTGGESKELPLHDFEAMAKIYMEKCPTWISFLNKIFGGDSELIDYVQRAVGYSLTGLCSEQVMFILHGHGKNGKSTFINIVMKLMGEYASTIPIQSLLSNDRTNIPNDLARLPGLRFVCSSEPNKDVWLDEGKVKQLTGGDPVMARFLNKEWFEFKPQFKLWLATNHLPRIAGSDIGIWRRIQTIPFTVTIPPEERDPNMEERLVAEGDGILSWMLAGAVEWFECLREGSDGGLMAPASVLAATEAYRNNSDIVGKFLLETCVLHAHAGDDERFSTSVATMYEEFTQWLETDGEFKRTKRWFGDRMKERGMVQTESPQWDKVTGKSSRRWLGVVLKKEVSFSEQ